MNAVQKGNDLEEKIFKLLKREISRGNFFAHKDNCKIFLKKGYYSRDREKDIIFDIAIEVYLPGQTTYSLLILVECKNYEKSVPVDDAEEFYQKVQQVAGANGKAIIAAKNSFQEGAIKFSKSKGIGLLRYFPRNEIKWELTRSPSGLASLSNAEGSTEAYKGLTVDSYESRYFDCYCYIDENYTNSLRLFFYQLLIFNLEDNFKNQLLKIVTRTDSDKGLVSFQADAEIEAFCSKLLQSINYEYGEVPLEKICQYLEETSKLRVIFENVETSTGTDINVLGEIRFNPPMIKIYQNFTHNQVRERFTLAHELGHYMLAHSRYMNGEYVQEVDLDIENPENLGVKDIMRMEWQANYFASCLLLPAKPFIRDFNSKLIELGLRNRGFGFLYLDHQLCNIQNFYNITNALKLQYRVSRSVIKFRLKKLGLLNEN